MSSNLPPGCSASSIPGNTPDDMAWEDFHEGVDRDTLDAGLSPDDAYAAWKMGLAALKAAREIGITFWSSLDDNTCPTGARSE